MTIATAAALLLALAVFAALAFHAHPALDDYRLAERLDAEGLAGAQVWWYEHWTGKFTCILATSVFLELAGFAHYWIAPLVLLAALGAALHLAIGAFAREGLSRRQRAAAALVALALCATQLPHPHEALYWLTGAWAWLLGPILALLLAGAVRARPRRAPVRIAAAAAAALLGLLAVGCNEAMLVVLVAAMSSWLAGVVRGRCRAHAAAFAALAGVLAGAALMVAAPGNSVRSGMFPGSHDLLASLRGAVTWTLGRVALWSANASLLGASLLALPLLGAHATARGRTLRIGCGLALLAAAVFPVYWATGHKPPERMRASLWLLFVCGWFALALPVLAAWLARAGWRCDGPRCKRIGCALLVLGLLQGNLPRALGDLASGRAARAAREQSARDALARAQAGSTGEVVLPALRERPKTLFIGDLTAQPDAWENRCYAAYFGLEAVSAR